MKQPFEIESNRREDLFAGGGEMGVLMRAFDWSKTPIGPTESWSPALRMMVRLLLANRFPTLIWWGPSYVQLYNDAYRPIPGTKHPKSMGQPGSECWTEIWHIIGPLVDTPFHGGPATWMDDIHLEINRHGFVEETHFTIAYSPVPDETAPRGIGGVLATVHEITEKVVGERRIRALRDLGTPPTAAKSAEEACAIAAATLATSDKDVPFALLYLLDPDGRQARLAGAAGVGMGEESSPRVIELGDSNLETWPFTQAKRSETLEVVEPLASLFAHVPPGPWSDPPDTAVVLPLPSNKAHEPAGFLVAGVSARLKFDDAYRGFIELATAQVGTVVANARAYEEERRRAEALAELDRVKTTFFSNVSHEFRTPLTLLLGPAEDALADAEDTTQRERLEVIRRNALRLQKLVNTLLDFSRIEAGRVQAAYEPTDLNRLTSELASNFRSAIERAGLRFTIDCRPLSQPAFVDREMWEKVVLNLLSNAFKFTLEGEIEVTLTQEGSAAKLVVRDTGTGIASAQLPHVFERFHRIEGARARTHEGTGIGLALVQELVKLHGGTIHVRSAIGRGAAFTVAIPLGKDHLPPDRIGAIRTLAPTTVGADIFIQEALRWLPDAESDALRLDPAAAEGIDPAPLHAPAGAPASRPLVLLADDNADMRDYLRKLLAPRYEVRAVPDGESALAAVRDRRPDLVLSDIMMPGLDGFGLLKALRTDPETASIPVILLSARAGEEATVEGMEAGADDYVAKPFSARELLARVGGALALARLRHESVLREAELKAETVRVLESITESFVAVDAQWRFTYVNAAAERSYGMTRQELLGRNLWEVFQEARGTVFEQEYRRAMADRVPARVEAFYEPFGRWFEVNVYPTGDGGVAFYFRDVSERKRAEGEIKASEARLRFLMDFMPQKIFTATPTGDVDYFNPVWTTFTGLSFEEIRDWGWTQFVHPDDVDENVRAWRHAIHTGEPFEFEHRFRRADGEYRWHISRACPILDEAGSIVMWIGSNTEVHEVKVAQEAMRDQDRRKDEFLATLAHELRNPLAPIRSGLQVLRATGELSGQAARIQEIMERQVGHMVRLIDDLLDVSRITRGKVELKRERVALQTVFNAAIETSRPLIEAGGHTLEVVQPDESLQVHADLTRLAQVFSNLLNNSAKYTPNGGHVRLSARRDGADVVVQVTDDGAGIPGEMLPNVFDLFTQVGRSTDGPQAGLGIGLSIVRQLVEMHQGTVKAESPGPGQGSTFTVRLASDPELKAPATAQDGRRPSSETQQAAWRVLLVDDNVDGAESLAMLLGLSGHETRTAHTGSAAVEAAREFRPDVVFLDIGLPGMDGYEVATHIRSEPGLESTVLIALTGWGSEEDRKRSHAVGFDGHITKPVEAAAIAGVLARLSPGRRHLERPPAPRPR